MLPRAIALPHSPLPPLGSCSLPLGTLVPYGPYNPIASNITTDMPDCKQTRGFSLFGRGVMANVVSPAVAPAKGIYHRSTTNVQVGDQCE